MMMHFSLHLFLTLTISSILGAASYHSPLEETITNLSKQLDEVQLQLNNSVQQILEKINDNTLDILGAISAAHVSQKSDKFLSLESKEM
jgi:hypothetical protein